MQPEGLDAFERIGEDVRETVEHRPASTVVVRTRKPRQVTTSAARSAAYGRPVHGPKRLSDDLELVRHDSMIVLRINVF